MHAKKNLTEHRLTRSCSTGGAELEIAELGQEMGEIVICTNYFVS